MSVGHGGNVLDQGLDLGEVALARQLGHLAAPVVGGQVLEGADRAGEKATADGAVGHDGDAQLTAGLEDARVVGLDV
ncbi:hypothetical protein E4U55_005271 [Claviceps digitariae]|nr:hypothetical protein E4U55_005271 [Claviceps digitariae]